jgi:hypothetical protein
LLLFCAETGEDQINSEEIIKQIEIVVFIITLLRVNKSGQDIRVKIEEIIFLCNSAGVVNLP